VTTSILIVEDEPAIREMVRFALERAGFSCREAGDSERALISIADRRPDLALIDWMLPGMNGIDLARRLKREDATKELPVIMLTRAVKKTTAFEDLKSAPTTTSPNRFRRANWWRASRRSCAAINRTAAKRRSSSTI